MGRWTQIGALLAALAAAYAARAEDLPLAVVTRTSESRFVHRITLMDEKGRTIGPGSHLPYSPKLTCSSSKCHNYDTIAKGTHSRAWPSLAPLRHRPDRFMWTLFDGTAGTAAPLSHGALAARPDTFDPKAHMGTFKLAVQFGPYHVGGGRMELDPDGQRYDAHLGANPALRTAAQPQASADYFGARWDQSGVIEVDCLACHALRGYDHVERAGQIASMNLKWAATVGAGFGVVEGKTSSLAVPSPDAKPEEGAEPPVKVKYNPAVFDPEGHVYLELGKPPDANCLFCHRMPAKGGAQWTDCLDADVHSKAGLRCVDCHRGGPDHVIAGNRKSPRKEFESLTCKGCHDAGRLGAPVPAHKGLPRLHLDKITCEACHSGPRPRELPLALERPVDPTWGVILSTRKASGPTVYAPVYERRDGGAIGLVARLLPNYFASRRPDKSLVPLDPSYVATRFRRAESDMKDDDADGVPEVNAPAEIKAMLAALKRKDISPAYVVGGRVYELDDKGEVKSEPTALGEPLDVTLSHNVRPAPQALGAQGCMECHSTTAPFLRSLGIRQALCEDCKPGGMPLFARIGRSELDLRLGACREGYVRPYGPVALGLVAALLILHYVLFGPKRYERRLPAELVARFGTLERIVHLALLAAFLCLATTGLLIAAGVENLLGYGVKWMHDTASWALIGGGLLALLLWARDMVFRKLDLAWMKVLGGYLGYKGHVPAGRFNAGQKAFFWFILLVVACLATTGLMMRYGLGGDRWATLVYTLHDACAWVMILCILVHAYLGSFANPGTLGAVFHGKVERSWLEHHHPDYKPGK